MNFIRVIFSHFLILSFLSFGNLSDSVLMTFLLWFTSYVCMSSLCMERMSDCLIHDAWVILLTMMILFEISVSDIFSLLFFSFYLLFFCIFAYLRVFRESYFNLTLRNLTFIYFMHYLTLSLLRLNYDIFIICFAASFFCFAFLFIFSTLSFILLFLSSLVKIMCY